MAGGALPLEIGGKGNMFRNLLCSLSPLGNLLRQFIVGE